MTTSDPSKPRPLIVVLDELRQRKEEYLKEDALGRALIDHERWIPMLEMHDILEHWLLTGRFLDEDPQIAYDGEAPTIPPRYGPGFG